MAKTVATPSPATQATKATQAPNGVAPKPTQEEIAIRAYNLYLERGGAPGNELQDWIEAERQLLEENGKAGRKATVKSAGV